MSRRIKEILGTEEDEVAAVALMARGEIPRLSKLIIRGLKSQRMSSLSGTLTLLSEMSRTY